MLRKIFMAILLPLSLFGMFGVKFLEPEEAFKPEVKVQDNKIVAKVVLGEDIYIYKEKVSFKILSPDGVVIKNIQFPEAIEHDEDLVYEGMPQFVLELEKNKPLTGIQDVELAFGFQGCSAKGICYEPIENTYTLKLDMDKVGSSEEKQEQPPLQEVSENGELSEVDAIASTLKGGSIWMIVVSFFGFGLLLALTPCVFPMIPIISGLIVSQGEGLTTRRAFFLSLVYVLAMAVAYTIAGVFAGLFGSNLQAALQNPYVVVSFALVFVALALSMFGYYELKLPDRFVSKVSATGQDKGGVVGVAVMGFLSALIVGPCVAAPLAGALVYIGQTGDAVLGGLALFAMSLGMGVPLIAVGTGAGKFMPKPGPWMTMINAIFGIIMLGVAVWMLDKIVSPQTTMFLAASLGIATALFFGVFDNAAHIFKRTIAWVVFIYSVALFIGVYAGGGSLLKPLAFVQISNGATVKLETKELQFKTVKNLNQLEILLEANKGKKIMLDFSAKWCTSCKELEEITFKDAEVQKKLANFVLIRADITENTDEQKKMSKYYGVFGPPVLLFVNEEGKLLKNKTIVGFVEPQKLLKILDTL